uniref:Uncharacterized protein n=1 Tax=Solanum tuberosum TaxID=4113 RepID=M1AUR9_SOLTU
MHLTRPRRDIFWGTDSEGHLVLSDDAELWEILCTISGRMNESLIVLRAANQRMSYYFVLVMDCFLFLFLLEDSMILLQDSMKNFCCGTRPQENQYYSPSRISKQMVQALYWHVSDDSPIVRRLCLRGLVQVLESSSRDAVEPILLDLSIRLRNLQCCRLCCSDSSKMPMSVCRILQK